MHLLVLLSLRTSTKALPSKNTTRCLSESRSSLFSLLCVLPQKVSIPLGNRGYFVERKQREWEVVCSFCSPGARSAVTYCPWASPVPLCSQGKKCNTSPMFSHSHCLMSKHWKTLQRCSIAMFFLYDSMDSGSLKQGSDENAYLAFHIKANAGEEKQCCKVQWNTLQPPCSAPSVLKHADGLNASRPGRGLICLQGSLSNTCFLNFSSHDL